MTQVKKQEQEYRERERKRKRKVKSNGWLGVQQRLPRSRAFGETIGTEKPLLSGS